MTYIKCYGCETMIDVPDELAGGLQGNHGDITSQMVEPYYCDSCERIALAAVAASMGDDYDDGGEYCLHCGKNIYDWSDLGCEYCDRRHPGFGTLD